MSFRDFTVRTVRSNLAPHTVQTSCLWAISWNMGSSRKMGRSRREGGRC